MNMMSTQPTTHLEEIDLFERCTPAQRRRARALGTIVDVGAGTTLVREGDQAAEFFVVLDGETAVSVRSAPVGAVMPGGASMPQLIDAEPWPAGERPGTIAYFCGVLEAPCRDGRVGRLRSDESGFDNLVLAGDWTDSGMNAGCIEAAVLSGLQAANAVRGRPRHHRIAGYYLP